MPLLYIPDTNEFLNHMDDVGYAYVVMQISSRLHILIQPTEVKKI